MSGVETVSNREEKILVGVRGRLEERKTQSVQRAAHGSVDCRINGRGTMEDVDNLVCDHSSQLTYP